MGDEVSFQSTVKLNESSEKALIPLERVERSIFVLRGQKVIIDVTLADLYGVTVKRLNEQVKRNQDRFPLDFMFQMTDEEHQALRSQSATIETGRGRHRKYLPYVFTEHGAIMAASVLNSGRAIEMSILVVRAFIKLRNILATNRQLATKLDELERKLSTHDQQIMVLFDAIQSLTTPAKQQRQIIGFAGKEKV